jgi:RNA polymerase nonessential primary-like sigma factor
MYKKRTPQEAAMNTDCEDNVNVTRNQPREPALLTAEQEVALGRRVQQGDKQAREQLIVSNLRLVISMARRYNNQTLPLPDRISAGNQGLITAVDQFDPERGVRFSTFAYMWIREAIEREMSRNSCISIVPTRTLRQLRQLHHLKRSHPHMSFYEAGQMLGLSQTKVDWLLAAHNQDADFTEDEENDHAYTPEQRALHTEARDMIANLLGSLPAHQAVVLSKYYGLQGHAPHTLAQIAADLSLSAERIRQVRAEAEHKIRRHLRAAGVHLDAFDFPDSTTG